MGRFRWRLHRSPRSVDNKLPRLPGSSWPNVLSDIEAKGYFFSTDWESDSAMRLAQQLGLPSGDLRDRSLSRAISPQIASNALSNTLSSRYGLGPFPPHTDTAYWRTPARYLMLLCKNAGKGGRMTSLVDTSQWKLDRCDEALLTGAIYTVHAARPFLATIAKRAATQLQIRYDRECMTPTSADAPAALKLVQSLLSNSPSKMDPTVKTNLKLI